MKFNLDKFNNLQFFRYLIIGGLVGLVFLGINFVLVIEFKFSLTFSNTISYAVTYPLSFWGHRKYTFRVKNDLLKSFFCFSLTIFLLFVFNNALLSFSELILDHIFVIALNLFFIIFVNYFFYRIIFLKI